MNRIEPYIGMPIILGDGGMQDSDAAAGQNGMQNMQQNMMQPAMQQPTMQQPVRPMPLPETAPQEQQNCQPCLTDTNCESCASHQPPQQTMVVGMAYVPWQRWQQPYDYEKGFEVGTIFPDLDLPFLGYQGGRRR